MPELTLYYIPACPFCRKVLNYIDQRQDITVSLKNLHENPDYQKELLESGGKTQVPSLLIDGKALYESDDIIQWFEEHKN